MGHDLLAWNANGYAGASDHDAEQPGYDFFVDAVVIVVFGQLLFEPASLRDGWPGLTIEVHKISDRKLLTDIAGVAAELHALQGSAGLGYIAAAPLGRTFHTRGRWQATHREARRERLIRRNLAQLTGQLVEWRVVS